VASDVVNEQRISTTQGLRSDAKIHQQARNRKSLIEPARQEHLVNTVSLFFTASNIHYELLTAFPAWLLRHRGIP